MAKVQEEQVPVSPQRSWWPRRVSVLTIVLALLTIGTFIAIVRPDVQYYPYMRGSVEYPTDVGGAVPPSMPMSAPSYGGIEGGYGAARATDASGVNVPSAQAISGTGGGMLADYAYDPDYYPYPYPSDDVSASDTRELLKVYYSADMRTRDVQGLTRRVETTVRGHDGRIDQISVSPTSGYVSFVMPKSAYEAFRTELEGLVDSRFLTVNIQSSNMLPQKTSIEDQQKRASTTLAEYQAARRKVVDMHASTVRSLQSQIDAAAAELARLRALTQTYDIQNQIQTLVNETASLKSRLTSENTSYTYRLDSADANIKSAQDWQKALATEDQDLLDSIATVNGSVSLQWISLWSMAQAYLPGYWIPTIFGVLTIVSFLWDRRRFGTVS